VIENSGEIIGYILVKTRQMTVLYNKIMYKEIDENTVIIPIL